MLGAEPVEALFRSSYLSEVVGVRLTDGRGVVVKRRVDESGRAARCVTAQRLLAEQGFPCPMPLTDVIVSEASTDYLGEIGRPEEASTGSAPRMVRHHSSTQGGRSDVSSHPVSPRP